MGLARERPTALRRSTAISANDPADDQAQAPSFAAAMRRRLAESDSPGFYRKPQASSINREWQYEERQTAAMGGLTYLHGWIGGSDTSDATLLLFCHGAGFNAGAWLAMLGACEEEHHENEVLASTMGMAPAARRDGDGRPRRPRFLNACYA